MNKPAYAALTTHSPTKPALIFVSSRRQTRLTALDIIAYAAADFKPTQWLRMTEAELADAIIGVKDANLKHTLQFGIGLHHAGLADRDRQLVERLFCEQRIMVLVATSTLAWGVNTPAHLVIVKGTEYFDAPSKRCAGRAVLADRLVSSSRRTTRLTEKEMHARLVHCAHVCAMWHRSLTVGATRQFRL